MVRLESARFHLSRTALLCAAIGALAFPIGSAGGVYAQVQPSPLGSLEQDLSGTSISLEYYRPSARGRVLFGDQVPLGEFWTPGANWVTKIRFSGDVELAGQGVDAGTYGLWMEASDSTVWRIMLTADTTLGHAPHLTENDGFLVADVAHETVPMHQETLLFQVDSVRPTGAALRMHWGTDRVTIPIGVDLGIQLAVEAQEAARYVGAWTRTGLPWPDDELAEERAAADSAGFLEAFDNYYESLLEPGVLEVVHRGGYLILDEGRPGAFGTMLIPRGGGFFIEGFTMQGEPAGFDPGDVDVWEFLFDENGRAIRGELWDDEGILREVLERAQE